MAVVTTVTTDGSAFSLADLDTFIHQARDAQVPEQRKIIVEPVYGDDARDLRGYQLKVDNA